MHVIGQRGHITQGLDRFTEAKLLFGDTRLFFIEIPPWARLAQHLQVLENLGQHLLAPGQALLGQVDLQAERGAAAPGQAGPRAQALRPTLRL